MMGGPPPETEVLPTVVGSLFHRLGFQISVQVAPREAPTGTPHGMTAGSTGGTAAPARPPRASLGGGLKSIRGGAP
eukprot:jgi/Botrbrau1/4929/Bobra.0122s0011.1